MSRKENIEKKTEELLEPIAKENGVSIYDVEYVKEAGEWYLRAYIDKPEGVNINDCVNVNHALSDALDVDDFIEEAYTLEVSSPGLGRTLKKDRHFANSLGILKSFDAENVVITINDQDKTFVRKEISVIKLALDF